MPAAAPDPPNRFADLPMQSAEAGMTAILLTISQSFTIGFAFGKVIMFSRKAIQRAEISLAAHVYGLRMIYRITDEENRKMTIHR